MSGVQIAWANALSESTLVFFTTLAPSAAFAYLALLILLFRSGIDTVIHEQIHHLLWAPLVLCMIGLIASATHLGNPSNALYVLMRVGSSPLSNEVFAAGAFLGMAAVFWLASFSIQKYYLVERIAMVCIIASGICFIAAISCAYHVETIVTWSMPLMPATIACSSAMGGPLLALCCLQATDPFPGKVPFAKGLAVVSFVATVAWLSMQTAIGLALLGIANELFTASELVPMFWPALVLSGVLCLAGSVSPFVVARRLGRDVSKAYPAGHKSVKQKSIEQNAEQKRAIQESARQKITAQEPAEQKVAGQESVGRELSARYWLIGASVSTLIGIFIMRFMFYMMHMTVGVAV